MFDDFTRFVVDWIQTQPLIMIYVYFALISYLENVVPPVPGDILVAFAGYLVAENVIGFIPVYITTTVASVLGFYHVYYLGKIWGKGIDSGDENHFLLKYLDIKYIDKAKQWMVKYGQGVVVANRFLAGTRSIIALVAGMTPLNLSKTMISSTVSSLLWNGILIGAGWMIHKNWQLIGSYLSNYGKFVFVIIALIFVYNWFKKRKVTSTAN
ncbi:DedA family protein [bacterium]|nr:MAG: DedA family protein [bacterium]